jgi:non-homologous end joining protein Ku
VRERVLDAIQSKVDGQDITADVKVGGEAKIIDLMEALKASLEKEKPEKEKEKKSRKVS